MPGTLDLTKSNLENLFEFLDKYSPTLSNSIKWQNNAASVNAYIPPTSRCTVTLSNWSHQQQEDLANAFVATCKWLASGAQIMRPAGLTDEPVNMQPNVTEDNVAAMEHVSPDYMWKLYLAHVAFSLAAEALHIFRWSIARYTAEQLRYLFDSTTMAWKIENGPAYLMGTNDAHVPQLRADNLPMTCFAPPESTFLFLKHRLIGKTRKDTICRVLDWMRHYMTHFYGDFSYVNMYAVWQYRGYPPLGKIIQGTVDSNNPSLGKCHYTAGCHGSVGFLSAVLRVLNIPVQPVWVSGHELACFLTERLYLDHGDDPYNGVVKNSSQPIDHVLIDEATYQSRFTTDLAVNITDLNSPTQKNVGLAATQFPQ